MNALKEELAEIRAEYAHLWVKNQTPDGYAYLTDIIKAEERFDALIEAVREDAATCDCGNCWICRAY